MKSNAESFIVVEGEYLGLKNGSLQGIIMQLICRDQIDALETLEDRRKSYKNLRIRNMTRQELLPKEVLKPLPKERKKDV